MLATLAIPGWLYYSLLMGADLASTKVAQRRGCVEANPLVGHSIGRQTLVKGVGFTLVWGAERKIEEKHPRIKFTMRAGVAGITGYAVAHNLTVECKAKR